MIHARLPRLSRTMLCLLALLGTPAAAFAALVPVTVDEKIGQALLSNSGNATELAELRALTGLDSLVLGSKVDVNKKTPVRPAQGHASTWILADSAEPGDFALKFGAGNGASADTFFFKNIGEMNLLVWNNEQVLSLTNRVCNNNETKCHVERLSHYITSPALQAPAKDSGQKETDQGSGLPGETTGGKLPAGGATEGTSAGGGLEIGNQQGGAQEQHEVPEPGSLALLALLAMGALGVYGARRRVRQVGSAS